MFGVGASLLLGATAISLAHGVLFSHRARIEAMEKRTEAIASRPAA
jgi:hypothetical protein